MFFKTFPSLPLCWHLLLKKKKKMREAFDCRVPYKTTQDNHFMG